MNWPTTQDTEYDPYLTSSNFKIDIYTHLSLLLNQME